jgi:methylmalonyl-CoA/ethylmalonyl-CoA epimerase
MVERMDHVGIVVKDLGKALNLYGDSFGLVPWEKGIVDDVEHGVRMVLLPVGDNFVEFIQPTNTTNRFARFLKERGEGLFHISVFIKDYDQRVASLRKKGAAIEEEVVHQPFPGYAIRLAWVPPDSAQGVWLELVDINSMPSKPG